MTKTHFDFSQFQSFSKDEQVKFFVDIIFNIANSSDKINDDILDDEIEELYFKSIKIIPRNIIKYEESLDNLDKIKTISILNSLNFRNEHEYGFYTNKHKLGYKVYLEFKRFIKNRKDTQETSTEKQIPANKIISNLVNLQAIGYLFTELIRKGLIQPIYRNGKINQLGTARMILEHFYFQDLDSQPNEEDVRKTLFEDNKLSEDKINLFEIPSIKKLNTK